MGAQWKVFRLIGFCITLSFFSYLTVIAYAQGAEVVGKVPTSRSLPLPAEELDGATCPKIASGNISICGTVKTAETSILDLEDWKVEQAGIPIEGATVAVYLGVERYRLKLEGDIGFNKYPDTNTTGEIMGKISGLYTYNITNADGEFVVIAPRGLGTKDGMAFIGFFCGTKLKDLYMIDTSQTIPRMPISLSCDPEVLPSAINSVPAPPFIDYIDRDRSLSCDQGFGTGEYGATDTQEKVIEFNVIKKRVDDTYLGNLIIQIVETESGYVLTEDLYPERLPEKNEQLSKKDVEGLSHSSMGYSLQSISSLNCGTGGCYEAPPPKMEFAEDSEMMKCEVIRSCNDFPRPPYCKGPLVELQGLNEWEPAWEYLMEMNPDMPVCYGLKKPLLIANIRQKLVNAILGAFGLRLENGQIISDAAGADEIAGIFEVLNLSLGDIDFEIGDLGIPEMIQGTDLYSSINNALEEGITSKLVSIAETISTFSPHGPDNTWQESYRNWLVGIAETLGNSTTKFISETENDVLVSFQSIVTNIANNIVDNIMSGMTDSADVSTIQSNIQTLFGGGFSVDTLISIFYPASVGDPNFKRSILLTPVGADVYQGIESIIDDLRLRETAIRSDLEIDIEDMCTAVSGFVTGNVDIEIAGYDIISFSGFSLACDAVLPRLAYGSTLDTVLVEQLYIPFADIINPSELHTYETMHNFNFEDIYKSLLGTVNDVTGDIAENLFNIPISALENANNSLDLLNTTTEGKINTILTGLQQKLNEVLEEFADPEEEWDVVTLEEIQRPDWNLLYSSIQDMIDGFTFENLLLPGVTLGQARDALTKLQKDYRYFPYSMLANWKPNTSLLNAFENRPINDPYVNNPAFSDMCNLTDGEQGRELTSARFGTSRPNLGDYPFKSCYKAVLPPDDTYSVERALWTTTNNLLPPEVGGPTIAKFYGPDEVIGQEMSTDGSTMEINTGLESVKVGKGYWRLGVMNTLCNQGKLNSDGEEYNIMAIKGREQDMDLEPTFTFEYLQKYGYLDPINAPTKYSSMYEWARTEDYPWASGYKFRSTEAEPPEGLYRFMGKYFGDTAGLKGGTTNSLLKDLYTYFPLAQENFEGLNSVGGPCLSENEREEELPGTPYFNDAGVLVFDTYTVIVRDFTYTCAGTVEYPLITDISPSKLVGADTMYGTWGMLFSFLGPTNYGNNRFHVANAYVIDTKAQNTVEHEKDIYPGLGIKMFNEGPGEVYYFDQVRALTVPNMADGVNLNHPKVVGGLMKGKEDTVDLWKKILELSNASGACGICSVNDRYAGLEPVLEAAGMQHQVPAPLLAALIEGEGAYPSTFSLDQVKNMSVTEGPTMPDCYDSIPGAQGIFGWLSVWFEPYKNAVRKLDSQRSRISKCNLLDAAYATAQTLQSDTPTQKTPGSCGTAWEDTIVDETTGEEMPLIKSKIMHYTCGYPQPEWIDYEEKLAFCKSAVVKNYVDYAYALYDSFKCY